VRECGRAGPGASRKQVVTDLRGAGAGITWIGENIVCLEGGRP